MNIIIDLYLETQRLIIRPYVEEDLMEFFYLMQDKELFTYKDMEVMPLKPLKLYSNMDLTQ